MKTARFLFTIVGFGALTLGLSYAGEPSSHSSEQNPRENHTASARPAGRRQGNGDQMDRKPSLLHNNGHALERSSQAGPLHTQINRTLGNELHQPGLKKAATAATGGLMMNKIENHHQQLARLPVGGGTTAPWPGVVRSRSATLAAIGGLTASSAKNSAAALNGAAIKRKP
jgi:hypothetical protein